MDEMMLLLADKDSENISENETFDEEHIFFRDAMALDAVSRYARINNISPLNKGGNLK